MPGKKDNELQAALDPPGVDHASEPDGLNRGDGDGA